MADGTGGINNSSRVCGQFFISTMCWLKSGSNTVQQCKHDIDRQRTGGHHHCRKWTFNIFCPARDLQRTVDTFCHSGHLTQCPQWTHSATSQGLQQTSRKHQTAGKLDAGRRLMLQPDKNMIQEVAGYCHLETVGIGTANTASPNLTTTQPLMWRRCPS